MNNKYKQSVKNYLSLKSTKNNIIRGGPRKYVIIVIQYLQSTSQSEIVQHYECNIMVWSSKRNKHSQKF